MSKPTRKQVNLNEQQYEILADYASSKGISIGEAVTDMQKDIDTMKSQSLTTISENTKVFCDQVDSMAEVSRLPEWLVHAIKITIRPIVMQGMLNGKDLDLSKFRDAWNIPANMKLVLFDYGRDKKYCFDKE